MYTLNQYKGWNDFAILMGVYSSKQKAINEYNRLKLNAQKEDSGFQDEFYIQKVPVDNHSLEHKEDFIISWYSPKCPYQGD
jgi:hypothetical protein